MAENKITFGVWETTTLLINAICARVFLNYPRNLLEVSGTSAWIEAIYMCFLALIGLFIIERLYARFPGKDIVDVSEMAGGGFLRVAAGVAIIFLLLFISSVILREYAENMKIISLDVSPISFVSMFFVIGMICGAYAGIEAIVRFHAIVVPIIAATYMFIIIAVFPFLDLTNYFPLLGNGIDKTLKEGFFSISIFAPLLYLFLVPPFIKTHRNFKRSGYAAWGFSAFFLVSDVLVYSAVVPYPTNTEMFIPIFQLARLINYGRFFQRVESVFMVAWACTALMYLSVILFFTVYVFKKTFKLQFYKPMILPFSVLIFTLSLLPPNLLVAIELETKYYSYIAWTITFLMTTIILLIAGGRENNACKESDTHG